MFGNWNECFTLSETPYVCILNDDDLLAADYVKCIIDLLAAHPDGDILQTGYSILDQRIGKASYNIDEWYGINFSKRSAIKPLTLQNLIIANMRMGCLGITYRRSKAIDIGGFVTDEYPTSDYYFNCRMLANGARGYEVATRLAVYRINENESMKPAILVGFIVNDYKLRCEAATYFRLPFFMKLYAFLTVSTHRYTTQRYWLREIPSNKIEEQIGIQPVEANILIVIYRTLNALLRRLLLI